LRRRSLRTRSPLRWRGLLNVLPCHIFANALTRHSLTPRQSKRD